MAIARPSPALRCYAAAQGHKRIGRAEPSLENPRRTATFPSMSRRLKFLLVPPLAVGVLLAGLWILEALFSDSATRLAFQIRNETFLLRVSGETKRTFVHRPRAWPNGLTGDYRIEITSGPLNPPEKRGIATAKSYDGPTWSGTTYHLNYVKVPQDLIARHRQGEPTLVTLEKRDGSILLIELK